MSSASGRRGLAPRLLTLSFALGFISPGLAAQPRENGHGADFYGPAGSLDPLRKIAAALADRWKVPVIIDPAISPTAPPRVPEGDLPIDQALDFALTPLRHVAWRVFYLAPGQRQSLPPAETLAATARALDQRELDSMLIENPLTKRAVLYLKDQPVSPSSESMREWGKLSREPVYLLYSTALGVDEATPERQFADLQRQQLEMSMKPEERALAMVQMMQLLQKMPPADFEEFTRRTLQVGLRLWDSTPPEQRQEMIHQSMELMKSFGAAPAGTRASGAGAPRRPLDPPPGDPRRDAKALAASLTERYSSTFLVEPALSLNSPLAMPDGSLPVEKALQEVTAAHPGTAWRRLHLTEAQLKRMPTAERLATVVRRLEALEPGSLLLENRRTARAILYLKDQPVSSALDAAIKAGRFRDPPIYLLYSTTPSARGGTPLERFADLQQQQIGWMLRMSPDQMSRSMEQVIRSFASSDDAARARLMGLPVMAGMMATWLPREAQERQTAPAR